MHHLEIQHPFLVVEILADDHKILFLSIFKRKFEFLKKKKKSLLLNFIFARFYYNPV